MNDLSQDLWEARRLGHTISAERDDLPKTKVEAFAVQDAIVGLCGLERCGYKVGSTSKEAQRLLHTDEPGMGVLFSPFIYGGPARLKIVPEQRPAVEGEFAFLLGKDLPWRAEAYMMAEIADAIESVGRRYRRLLERASRADLRARGGC